MTKRKAPCYKCERRSEGCHSKCEAYIEYKTACEADYDMRKAHATLVGYEAKRTEKMRKQWERKQQIK